MTDAPATLRNCVLAGLRIHVTSHYHHATGAPEWRADATYRGEHTQTGYGATQLAAVEDCVLALRQTRPEIEGARHPEREVRE
jgi:hypothetical protein